jgi:hypothetical protein
MLVACGDGDREGSKSATEEPLTTLDCTDVEGAPEDLPNDTEEVYLPGVMAKLLERDEVLRDRFGKSEVRNCDEARRFAEIYQEEAARIEPELLAEAPEIAEADVLDASEDVGDAEDAPPDDVPTDAATEIAKISNGVESSYSYVLELYYPSTANHCTGTPISNKAFVTAAHCQTIDGATVNTNIGQQLLNGASRDQVFKGAVPVKYRVHPWYWGTGCYAFDLAVGFLLEEYPEHVFSNRARMYNGDIELNSRQYLIGYGKTSTTGSTGPQHYGYGLITDVNALAALLTAETPARTACKGDSGGPMGNWHSGYFMVKAVMSYGECGVDVWNTRLSFNMAWIEYWLSTEEKVTCSNYSSSGQPYKKCWK